MQTGHVDQQHYEGTFPQFRHASQVVATVHVRCCFIMFNQHTGPTRAAGYITQKEETIMDMKASMPSNLDQIRDQQRETWDRFSAGWKKWDTMVLGWLAPFGESMIRHANLREDSKVLDVAAGTGEPGLTAAALVPRGRVIMTDLAERMLAVTAENAARRGLRNVETRVCDAGALPFTAASFDAVLCRFGFMFFPDVAAAAHEFARVAKPGATICTAVWGEPSKNPWATTIMGTIARHVAMPTPPPGSPGLFRCAPAGFMSKVFAEAGLRDIAEEEVSCDMVLDTPQRYWEFMTDIAAPVVAGLAKADEVAREKIRAEVLESGTPVSARRCRPDAFNSDGDRRNSVTSGEKRERCNVMNRIWLRKCYIKCRNKYPVCTSWHSVKLKTHEAAGINHILHDTTKAEGDLVPSPSMGRAGWGWVLLS